MARGNSLVGGFNRRLVQCNRGFGLLGALAAALIISIVMMAALTTMHMLGSYASRLGKLLDRFDASPVAVVCGTNSSCKGTPAICLTSHGNDSTLACTIDKPCTFVDGAWQRSNIACDSGMLFKQKL